MDAFYMDIGYQTYATGLSVKINTNCYGTIGALT